MAWTRKAKPEAKNPYYNTYSNSGYSTCCEGHYYTEEQAESRNAIYWAERYGVTYLAGGPHPHYNVLPNCVGLACGAFNETYVRNMELKGTPVTPRQRYALNCNARDFIKRAESIGLETLTPDKRPPLGGIVVWGKNRSNHVAYITKVFDDDSCQIIHSGYGGWNGGGGSDPVWDTVPETIRRENGWKSTNGDSGNCSGFIVNPAIGTEVISDDPTPVVNLKSITLNTTFISVQENSQSLLAVVQNPADYDLSKATVSWTSSDTNVVTVDSSGTITGQEAGLADITVSVIDAYEYTATCRVVVTADPKEVTSISIDDVTIDPKQNYAVPITVKPDTGELVSSLSWTSSNTDVATITEGGVVCGRKGGKTKITVSTVVDSNTLTDTCEVTVRPRKGVYIKGKFYIPYIFYNGKWRRASAKMWKDKKWKNSIEDISKNS